MKPSIAIAALLLVGCGATPPVKQEAKKAAPAASVSNAGVKEGDLATIRLTPESERRLGIATARAEVRAARGSRVYTGEAVLPPGRSLTVAAPVAGTITSQPPEIGARVSKGATLFRMSPLAGVQRDLRVNAEADLAAANARLEGAKQRLDRAERLLRDEVGSVRQKEQAEEEVRVASAAVKGAAARLDQIKLAPLDADTSITIHAPGDGIVRQVMAQQGQMAPGGAPLAEIARVDELWLRVPVYAGESRDLAQGSAVEVRPLNAREGPPLFAATPVNAPPTGDPLASAVDLYYTAPGLKPGERVSVSIPLRAEDRGLAVPWAAVLYDIHGGAWVYERTAPLTYTRRRIEARRVSGGLALLRRGLADGAEVVTAGAAELFGVEFGPGK